MRLVKCQTIRVSIKIKRDRVNKTKGIKSEVIRENKVTRRILKENLVGV